MTLLVRRTCRPFTSLDGMILIAATAGGFGLSRCLGFDVLATQNQWTASDHPWLDTIATYHASLAPLVFSSTAGLLMIRLRHPRQPLSRLTRQPGLVAGLAATIVGVLLSAYMWLTCIYGHGESIRVAPILVNLVIVCAGTAVPAAWAMLALGRRWRHEPGWIDTLGMILGAYWVAGVPVLVYQYVH